MLTTPDTSIPDAPVICSMLRKLGYPSHRLGYSYLIIAIARYAQGDIQSLSKELYPYIAGLFGYSDWYPVEHAIRSVAEDAWKNGDREAWAYYFPGCRKAPSNKQLIATLAERVQQSTPPENRRG